MCAACCAGGKPRAICTRVTTEPRRTRTPHISSRFVAQASGQMCHQDAAGLGCAAGTTCPTGGPATPAWAKVLGRPAGPHPVREFWDQAPPSVFLPRPTPSLHRLKSQVGHPTCSASASRERARARDFGLRRSGNAKDSQRLGGRGAGARRRCSVAAPSANAHATPHGDARGAPRIPETRMGSGTSWLPRRLPDARRPLHFGRWTLMLQGKGFFSTTGREVPAAATSWESSIGRWQAASRPVGGGQLQLRAMLSAEPWTIGSRATRCWPIGESYQGAPAARSAAPSRPLMELAALYERRWPGILGSRSTSRRREPAVGPVAFPHRPSAADDPWRRSPSLAGRHPHTFGVVTAGCSRERELELPGSTAGSRTRNRTNFDTRAAGSIF